MTKFTREQINDILGYEGNDGRRIDIFELYGILFLGNSENRKWDLNKNYTKSAEGKIPISIDDFEYCETEDEVRDTFNDTLKEAIANKLL